MDLGAIGHGLKVLDISTAELARENISEIDDKMDTLNTGRAQMAASQNQLQSALSTATESLSAVTAASSRILDADFAQESARMTANSIRMQAGAAALGQANVMSQSVMSLI